MSSRHLAETRDETGSALIWALMFVVVTSGMVISHAIFVASNRKERDARYDREALGQTFARSALIDAQAWYNRQRVQPVVAFDPRRDLNGDPPVCDTLDQAIGLVRAFEIRGNLWGRYEVRRERVADISPERGVKTAGSVWSVEAQSYVYRLVDPALPFSAAPNRVIATTNLSTEMRSVPFTLPAPAAVCLDDGANFKAYPATAIKGRGSVGIAFPDSGASDVAPAPILDINGAATVDGTPALSAVPTYDASAKSMFSMRLDELRSYSDEVWPSNRDGLTVRNRLVFVSGDLMLTTGLNVDGSLIVVDGDLTMTDAQNSVIQGVLYVTGDAFVSGTLQMKGSIVVRGRLETGQAGPGIQFEYDAAVVEDLRRRLSQYRLRKSVVPGQ